MSARRAQRITTALLALVMLSFTLLNRELPLVRNSLVYARASEHVIEHGYDPRPVVADSHQSYDKPILYAWLSAPLVARLGTHDGLRLTSLVTTLPYLAVLVHFARSFRTLLPERMRGWFIGLAALGPCVVYQAWSAHPDGAFAALVVLAWSFTRRLVVERERSPVPNAVALGATLLVAVLLKNYGLVLLVSCPLYLLAHLRALRAEPARFRKLLASTMAAFGVVAVFALLAWLGLNPLSRLEGEGGGVGQYGNGELARSAGGTLVALVLALGIQFHVALAFALKRNAWSREIIVAFACFAGPYVLLLMPFPTSFYNMRYFVPLFALGALALSRGAEALEARARTRWLASFAVVASALVVLFNSGPVYRAARRYVPKLEVNWIGVPLSLLDNLRMPLHLAQAEVLDNINARVPAGATLYLLDVNYYGDAQQGVYERAGRIRSDIVTRYVSSRDFASAEPVAYVWRAPQRPLPSSLVVSADLEFGLVRCVPR